MFFKLFGKESELSFCVDLSHEKFVIQPGGKIVFVFQLILLLRDHNIKGFEGTPPLFIEFGNIFVLLFQIFPEELQTVRGVAHRSPQILFVTAPEVLHIVVAVLADFGVFGKTFSVGFVERRI